MQSDYRRRSSFSGYVLIGTCGVLCLTAAAAAQQPQEEDGPEPILGCGKAQALAAQFHDGKVTRADAAYSEAMGDTDVLHHELDIVVSALNPGTQKCTITGTNRMTIQSKSAVLTEFTFRLFDNFTITSALENDTTPVTVTIPDGSSTTRVVTLAQTYGLDDTFTLTIEYTGTTEPNLGFGSIEVHNHSGTEVVSTLSEPYYSGSWWPVKDGDEGLPGDNSDKATLDFWITVPEDFLVPSNGLLVSEETVPPDQKRYYWHTDYPIVPYLVSFAATNYTKWEQTYYHARGEMPVEFYIYPEYDTPEHRADWELVVGMLETFASLFGEYPFVNEKYGIYNFPFGGGMEHQTITGQSGFTDRLTVHELAHQWWGDMITCKSWCDIWLNEGFATYSECLWKEYESGASDPVAYFACMQDEDTKPTAVSDTVYVPPEDTDDLLRIFSLTYSYQKGAWVLHQLRHVVGDDTFFRILANYRSAYEYSAASTDDFAGVASSTFGQDLTWFFVQWVYEQGAPKYDYGWSTVNVAGQDYLLLKIAQVQQAGYPDVFIMPVDVVATIGGGDETVTVWNDLRTQWFVAPVTGPVTALQFDPNQWILRLATVDVGYDPGPPKILATDPAPGASPPPEATIDTVTITFHTNVDTSASHFSLVGQFSGPASFTIATTSNVNPVVLDLDAPLVPDLYTLTISDGLTAADSGLALDGEVADSWDAQSLPSGDGDPGGVAVIRFSGSLAAIPTVSQWGVVVMTLLVLMAGTLVFGRGAMPTHA